MTRQFPVVRITKIKVTNGRASFHWNEGCNESASGIIRMQLDNEITTVYTSTSTAGSSSSTNHKLTSCPISFALILPN